MKLFENSDGGKREKNLTIGIYYVWYMAIGDANHSDSTAACVTTIIKPANKTEKPEEKENTEKTEENAASGPVKGKTYKAAGQKYYAVSNNTVFLKKAKKKKIVTILCI